MLDSLGTVLLDFRYLVYLAIPVGLVVLFLSLGFTANLEWSQRRMRVFGLFYNMEPLEILHISTGFLRVLFVAAVVLFALQMKAVHIIFYVVIFLLCNLTFFAPKRFLFDLVNAVVVFAALLVGNILMGYYRDVSGDGRIFTVYALLGLFVVVYSLYFYLKDCTDLLRYKIETLGVDAHE